MSSRQYDAAAAARSRYLPVESAMPGTTLELIPMEVCVLCVCVCIKGGEEGV